ncbi:uncharacterized protein LOC123533522 isoform X1 [Mercenaria mercenaria]|uniref:uncharacterized protein LOC123533522 isoform X1 n=1 Tax=Mercenaria mercenaria TaxID=6596 RepID=UPI00234F6592|nr:uncharacterized protein LOC123533522 isoform X1 [Mercenaria mercenaria]
MMSEPFTVSSRGPVPSQDFSSREHVPSQDFIMMNNNNNYLPGVSRLGDSVQLLRPPLLSNTPNLAAPNPTLGPNCALDTGRISTNIIDYNSAGSRLNVAENEPYIAGTGVTPLGSPFIDMSNSSTEAEVEMKPSDLCDLQGPMLAQNSNVSQNSDSTNAYYMGSHNQACMNNFTFTTPTQSYLHSPALTATTQNRLLRPQTFAPGCNAQWKHAVPRRTRWLHHGSVSCPQGLSVFTVSQQENASAGTNTFYSPQMNEPVASCSELTRRAKRRHTIDTIEEGCPSNKIHLTEDKIASHMKDLRIHNFSPPPGGSIPTGNQYVDTGQRGNGVMSDSGQGRIDMMSDTGQGGVDTMSDTHYPRQSQQNGCHSEFLRHSQRQWHDFKLLEEKLQMIDEDSTSENEDSTNSQPVLHIVDGIKVGLKTVLPQDILDKIRNPCQEVVLWSPGIIPPKKEDDPDKETDNSPDCDDMMEDSISANVPSCEEREIDLDDSGMETDPDDEIL